MEYLDYQSFSYQGL
ncbi:hypothetical protein [Enterococcus sp. AZ194]